MIRRLRAEQRGASTVVVALCMTVVLIVVALVVDIGATAARKAQLQDAADAAALAVAQSCYQDEATTTRDGCAPAVAAQAEALANGIANDTVQGGIDQLRTTLSWPTDTVAPFARETVVVSLTSVQSALFSFDRTGTDVLASAEAEWRQTVALPLAVNSCVLPDADAVGPQFIGTGLYTGVADLLGSVIGNLDDASLIGYLDNILSCGVSVLAGGWMQSLTDGCTYDPTALVSTLSSTVERLLPINQIVPGMCSSTIEDLVGKRIIVPTFEHAVEATAAQLLGLSGTITFTEIVVTGYDFDGILGIGSLKRIESGTPGCANTLNELLGLDAEGLAGLIRGLGNSGILGLLNLPGVAQLVDALGLGSLLTWLLNTVANLLGSLLPVATNVVDAVLRILLSLLDLCQGVQGYVVASGMSADQAAERLAAPVRLVA